MGPSVSFFEGTEKKLEIVIDPTLPSLLSWEDETWRRICRAAGAEILSRISNEACIAYLLSESSLFVFAHKLVMITCGRTTLPDALLELLAFIPPDQVRMLVYQRKNETSPREQPTSFLDDARRLDELLPGRAFRFGHQDEHHLYLFHLDRPFAGDPTDVTLEVLMYGLDPSVGDALEETSSRPFRDLVGLDRILPAFEIDDHLFEPSGYSLNAIRGDEYYTIHVTPNDACSYASFESNCRLGGDLALLMTRLMATLRPRAYDVVVFDRDGRHTLGDHGYDRGSQLARDLDIGYRVRFATFRRPQADGGTAVELPL